ncbi:ATP-binding protein [Burkholderia cenocepacia]|uniref:ATP-binding protein n=1 Tax=Burkholderia cenocepacia TaxID=95486 RepID=UPI001CF12948|nr:ATP-binding protein [Burkholderia cenocepacia]MCA7967345.1 ATP-binding protein [Burkholderia cenocepacia]
MAAKQYAVEVQSDFLEKITRAKPVPALSELIWNSFDADAKNVEVSFEYNDLDALDTIVVKDDGEGLPWSDAEGCFTSLGGSWKKSKSQTALGRFLHGQEGRGRFKAFALGRVAEWEVVYRRDDKLWTYTIRMSAIDIRHVNISDETEVKGAATTGTTLTIAEPIKDFRTFTTEDGRQELTEVFALYLADYEDARIVLDGTAIDPGSAIAGRKFFNLADLVIDNKHHRARLEVVEWKTNGNRALYLCNEQRFPLLQVDRRFHILGQFQFSGYIASPYLDLAQKEGTVDLAEMQPGVLAAISEAQQVIKDHFRARAAEQARTVVEEWKDQEVYPFSGEPVTPVEKVERQVFDIVAVNVARHLPDFSASQPKNRKFQLRMLRQAIERSPEDLQIILDEVLNLPKKQREELAQLLRDTTLPAIIGAAKIVSDRLKFLTGLEAVLFDPEPKKRLKERSQLHRIIAQNCWLFGEEFGLSVDDRSLTEVLIAHKKMLDPDIVIDAPVKHISQTRGIVDLMLSKATKRHVVKLTHLVVELKAPKVPVAAAEVTQIESYAFSVMNDPRFKQVDTTWVFWVISDELAPYTEHRVQDDAGLIHTKGNLSIYAKTWGQVIEENRARLKFFQDKLEVQVDRDASLKYLQERYAAYLEGVFEEEANEEAEVEVEADAEGSASA